MENDALCFFLGWYMETTHEPDMRCFVHTWYLFREESSGRWVLLLLLCWADAICECRTSSYYFSWSLDAVLYCADCYHMDWAWLLLLSVVKESMLVVVTDRRAVALS